MYFSSNTDPDIEVLSFFVCLFVLSYKGQCVEPKHPENCQQWLPGPFLGLSLGTTAVHNVKF